MNHLVEHVNDNSLPSDTHDSYFIFEYNAKIDKKYDYNYNESGKWMMFFPLDQIDEKWKLAKQLYNSEKLIGIKSMKVSTMKPNERASNQTDKVIIFYCGPVSDEENLKKYGRNLIKCLDYKPVNKFMCYKSDIQTLQGTVATGNKSNSVYRLSTVI